MYLFAKESRDEGGKTDARLWRIAAYPDPRQEAARNNRNKPEEDRGPYDLHKFANIKAVTTIQNTEHSTRGVYTTAATNTDEGHR